MARGTTLLRLLDKLRVAARLSLNPAHNTQNRDSQVTMLQVEQERLWGDFDWPHLRIFPQVALEDGQRYVETPSNMHVDRIEKIEVFTDGAWVELTPGIDGCHYSSYNSDLDERSWPPRRWKLNEDEDVELWPIPDRDGDATTLEGYLRFTGIRNLNQLVDDGDRADLDDDMLVGYVAAQMLAATGAKDARLKLDGAQARDQKLRGRLTPRRRFQMYGTNETPPDNRLRITQYRPAGS